MALSNTTIWEVQTGGSDTLNGGAFDPGQTAGMFTDGAATAALTTAPVFTSASYTFLPADVGAWVFIGAGTNWSIGWYQITSVSGGAATLVASIGTVPLPASTAVLSTRVPQSMNTVAGCATVTSPTGATWSIDYSQQAAAQFTYTDLASAGTGLTVSSAAKPFAKQQVGNMIVIASGTNFNVGRYVIASVAAAVATVVGPTNITTGAGASGVGGQGGALAHPSKAAGAGILSFHYIFVKNGTYLITTTTGNVSGGTFTGFSTACTFIGYGTNRHPFNTDTKPLLQYQAALSTATLFATGHGFVNFACDGNNQTAAKLVSNINLLWRCSFTGFNTNSGGLTAAVECTATGNSAGIFSNLAILCEAYANTATPFAASSGNWFNCLSYNNTGATTDGFANGSAINCVSYANGRRGFGVMVLCWNCYAEGNTTEGYNNGNVNVLNKNCAGYNNTTSLFITPALGQSYQMVQGALPVTSGSALVNPGSANFALNATALRGALLRAAGFGSYPRELTIGYPDIGAAQHLTGTRPQMNLGI